MSRTVADKYKDGYPAGQIEPGVLPFDSDTLQHWIAAHTGDPMQHPEIDHWNSTSNVREVTVGGAPAVAFDYVMNGPESPGNFHATAVVLRSKYVLLIDWWAYASSGYEPTIDAVASSLVASLVFT